MAPTAKRNKVYVNSAWFPKETPNGSEDRISLYQRVAGVKGTASLVALRRERNSLKQGITHCKSKTNKVTHPKAQFTSKRGTKQGFVQHKTCGTDYVNCAYSIVSRKTALAANILSEAKCICCDTANFDGQFSAQNQHFFAISL